jgi:hypothetical protein
MIMSSINLKSSALFAQLIATQLLTKLIEKEIITPDDAIDLTDRALMNAELIESDDPESCEVLRDTRRIFESLLGLLASHGQNRPPESG